MHTLTLRAIVSEDLPIPGTDPWYADPCDPALAVMTDFRERTSITVSENATIDAALEHMRHTGVRCAFAIEDDRRVVVGLITAYDIMSEKPIRHVRAVAGRWHDVQVRDIMQNIVDWRVADIREIERRSVTWYKCLMTHQRRTCPSLNSRMVESGGCLVCCLLQK